MMKIGEQHDFGVIDKNEPSDLVCVFVIFVFGFAFGALVALAFFK